MQVSVRSQFIAVQCNLTKLTAKRGWVRQSGSILLSLKAGSHQYLMVFDGIQRYCNTLVQPFGNTHQILNTGKYLQYRQILGIVNRTRFYSQYREIPSATVGNHMGIHQIPLDTFGNPEYSNYLLFKRFLRRTRSSNKRWRPQTICSRASIVFIRTNPVKIQIYRQLLLATQIPRYLTVFGLPTSNTEYCQILPNTI